MSGRNLSSALLARIQSNEVSPILLLDLGLNSGTAYAWSGVGSIVWNGNTYLGVGTLGGVGDVTESLAVRADGTSITLSGIDSTMLSDVLNDIQVGAAATLWVGALVDGAIVGSPYALFKGTVDRPALAIGPKSMSITIALETKMANLQRASGRRFTSPDQRVYYPDDIGFHWVESQNDAAFRWG